MLGRGGYLGIVGEERRGRVGEGRCGRDDGDWNLYFLAGEKKRTGWILLRTQENRKVLKRNT